MTDQRKGGIAWTHFTSNPIRARWKDDSASGASGHYCEKISPGCANCYASELQPRFRMPKFDKANPDLIEPYLDEKELQRLLKRRKPCKVFLGDMTDIFGDWVPDEWLDRIFAVMALTPHITYQLLTKRAERMRRYFQTVEHRDGILDNRKSHVLYEAAIGLLSHGKQPAGKPPDWPLPNVHLGVSVETQEYADKRIPDLLQTPAAVRFLSVEPLLEPVDLEYPKTLWPDGPQMCCNGTDCACGGLPVDPPLLYGIDWVIVGGESGPKARPMHPDWVQAIRDQCVAAGVPFFFKQWGAWWPGDPKRIYREERIDYSDGSCAVRVGKKAAGRMLDGQEWSEFPA